MDFIQVVSKDFRGKLEEFQEEILVGLFNKYLIFIGFQE